MLLLNLFYYCASYNNNFALNLANSYKKQRESYTHVVTVSTSSTYTLAHLPVAGRLGGRVSIFSLRASRTGGIRCEATELFVRYTCHKSNKTKSNRRIHVSTFLDQARG